MKYYKYEFDDGEAIYSFKRFHSLIGRNGITEYVKELKE